MLVKGFSILYAQKISLTYLKITNILSKVVKGFQALKNTGLQGHKYVLLYEQNKTFTSLVMHKK